MKYPLLSPKGFTIIEILLASILLSVVFAGSVSVYISSLKFLKTAQANDVSVMPVVSLETIAKVISLSSGATLSAGNSQLNLQADYPVCGDFTTTNGGVNNYWHYRFVNSSLVTGCDNSAATVLVPPGTVLIPNVNTGTSTFQLINPSASGAPTVVAIHLETTSPVATLETKVDLGAMPKG